MYNATFAARLEVAKSKLKCPTSDISEFKLVTHLVHMLTTRCRHDTTRAFRVLVSIKWQKQTEKNPNAAICFDS